MRIAASLAVAFALTAAGVSAQELRTYAIAGDAIPDSLSGQPGDAERGRAIVANRTVGLCLLCHLLRLLHIDLDLLEQVPQLLLALLQPQHRLIFRLS